MINKNKEGSLKKKFNNKFYPQNNLCTVSTTYTFLSDYATIHIKYLCIQNVHAGFKYLGVEWTSFYLRNFSPSIFVNLTKSSVEES